MRKCALQEVCITRSVHYKKCVLQEVHSFNPSNQLTNETKHLLRCKSMVSYYPV